MDPEKSNRALGFIYPCLELILGKYSVLSVLQSENLFIDYSVIMKVMLLQMAGRNDKVGPFLP